MTGRVTGPVTGPVTYRPERPGDEAAVARVVREAFGDRGVDRLLTALRSGDAWVGLSFVAEVDGGLAGHVAITRSRLDAPAAVVDVLVLSPLSVAPERQGHGVGSGLVRYALGELRTRPEPLLFLEGSPHYYSRFGFVPAGGVGFRRPSLRIPEAAFQVLPLPSFEADRGGLSGTLVYHRAFWDHDAVGLRDERP